MSLGLAFSSVPRNLATSESWGVLSSGVIIKGATLIVPCSALYQIAHLGDDDEEPEFSSAMQLEEGETFFFAPRPLKNLIQVDELESLSPIMSTHVRTGLVLIGQVNPLFTVYLDI